MMEIAGWQHDVRYRKQTPTGTGQEALKKLLKEDETDMKFCMSQLFDRWFMYLEFKTELVLSIYRFKKSSQQI